MRYGVTLVGAFALASISCGSAAECIIPPCPAPVAINVAVTMESGASLPGSFVQVVGGSRVTCNTTPGTTCRVSGSFGTYQLDVGAPGFQTERVTVVVPGRDQACSCPVVETQQVNLALAPS